MQAFLIAALFSSRHRQWRYRCAIAMYVMVLIIGAIPGTRADVGEYASGFVLHSFCYSVLTFLLFSGSPGTGLQRAVKAVATVVVLGALDEYVQSFFPYRHATVRDWLVDCGAATVTSIVLWTVWPKPEHRLLA